MRITKNIVLYKLFTVLILSAILVITSFSLSVGAEETDVKSMKLTYEFNRPILSKVEIQDFLYDRVTLSNGFSAGKPGEPNIPSKGAYILLPPNQMVSDIQVLVKNQISIGSDYNIDPISEPIPIMDITSSVKIKKDSEIYNKNE